MKKSKRFKSRARRYEFIFGTFVNSIYLFVYGFTFYLIQTNTQGNCYASISYIPLLDNPENSPPQEYGFQRFGKDQPEKFQKFYSNVSLYLSVLIAFQFIIYSLIIVKDILKLLNPNINQEKGWGLRINRFGYVLHFLRFTALLVFSQWFFFYETQVCLCSYRGWYYENCYMFEAEKNKTVNNMKFRFKCFPLETKGRFIDDYV